MSPFDVEFELEIETARLQLEAGKRKVLVVGIVAEATDEGKLCRSVSAGTKKSDALIFIAGLEREIARIKRLIGESAQ